MRQNISNWRRWWLIRLLWLLAATFLCIGVLSTVLASAAPRTFDWVNPAAKTLQRTGSIPNFQNRPVHFYNLDCTTITYRVPTSSEMRTGCFTETAFGWLDGDSQIAIFRGTDEGLPLKAYASGQVLAPWPDSLSVVSLISMNTGGMGLAVYQNPLKYLQDTRNSSGQLTAKRIAASPDVVIRDKAGKSLVINSQTLAFSDGGAYLVAESLGGAFIRINVATLEIVAFAPALMGQPVPRSHVAVSESGRFVVIASQTTKMFRVYDLATCGPPVGNLDPQGCRFFEYRPSVEQQVGSLQSIRHIRFIHDGLLSFEAIGATQEGTYLFAPADTIDTSLDYLALGDSFTSGEGAFNYLSGTDTSANTCHLSMHSYPLGITREVFSEQSGRSVACSGARIHDIASTHDTYTGQVRGGKPFGELKSTTALGTVLGSFSPGIIAQHRFAKQHQPKAITVSVGGNDIGFGSILKQCVQPRLNLHPTANTCYNTYEDRLELLQLIDKTMPRWVGLFKQLQVASPQSHIFAIGYPQLADAAGKCGINVQLTKGELEFIASLISYLNMRLEQAATQAQISFIDISNALKGHRLCETASHGVAVNGLTAGKDSGALGIEVLGRESYHPNALGHDLVKQAILTRTNNFKHITENSPVPAPAGMLDKPKTGRPITSYIPATVIPGDLVKPKQTYAVSFTGTDYALRPNSVYKIYLNGTQGTLIGTTASTDTGNIHTSVTTPSQIPAGSHSLDILGENQAGEPVRITQPIIVPAPGQDSDNDALPDSQDTCPYIPAASEDSDHDGIDDGCDATIGQVLPLPSQQAPARSNLLPSAVTVVQTLRNSQMQQATSVPERGYILGAARTTLRTQARVPHHTIAPPDGHHSRLLLWLALLLSLWLAIIIALVRRRKRNERTP